MKTDSVSAVPGHDARSEDPAASRDDRRSAALAFDAWQRQWPTLFRGEAWLHLQRLKRAIVSPDSGRRDPTAAAPRKNV